jgi:leucyl/phenylalanyl-tRNA--protein transferase
VIFPDPRAALDEGILCVGGDLSVPTLLEAYSRGIFPWPQEGYPLLWFSPPERGILDFARVHIARRLQRELRKPSGESPVITFDQDFAQVITECARIPRAHEKGTWILPEMQKAYLDLHQAGYAHSVECWRGSSLVGGLYGVFVQGVFSGESMFFHESNASKRCLLALIERLKAIGVTWMDTQMVTPVLKDLGAHAISRDEYLLRLDQAHRASPKIF